MSKKSSETVKIPSGTVHRTIGLLQSALTKLNAAIDPAEIERIGIMVNRAMSLQQRSFHTAEHIFGLADPEDAHCTLSAIFHDIVYYQVDEGFLDDIEKLVKPYIIINPTRMEIRQKIDLNDRAFYGTAAVFGYEPGRTLSPFTGLNEFLSALVMNLLLEGIVKDRDLLIATAGIESTIPFRGPDSNGRKPAELLEIRVRETNRQFDLGLSEEEIKQTVISAVCFSNKDVENFAEEDPGEFLDNTWKLLPESNPTLNFQGLYTLRSYSTALMKMEGFLSQLKPEAVFEQYEGLPDDTAYNLLLSRAGTNMTTGCAYLGIKMISTGILLALAELSGGDAPVSFFMGDLNPKDKWSSLSSHLPDPLSVCKKNKDESSTLHRLLEHGRSGSSRFDLQNSPLSLFVFRCLSEAEQKRSVELSRSFFKEEIDPRAFLDTFPKALIEAIAKATSFLAFTRREKLLEIAEEFSG